MQDPSFVVGVFCSEVFYPLKFNDNHFANNALQALLAVTMETGTEEDSDTRRIKTQTADK